MSDELIINYSDDIHVKIRHNQNVYVELSQQGPRGPRGDKGDMGGVTPELLALRDDTLSARNDVNLMRVEVSTASASASQSAAAALNSKSEAADSARGAAESAASAYEDKLDVIDALAAVRSSQTLVEIARDQAQSANSSAEIARSEAVSAKTDAELARVHAQNAKAEALAASEDSSAAADLAAESASKAKASELAAAASAVEAARFDPTIYPLKENNGADFDNPQAVLANIGAQPALEIASKEEAESGVSTVGRIWTAELIKQAIVALIGGADHIHTVSDITDLTETLVQYAQLNSPNFIGNPTAPTPSTGDSTAKLATTAFVQKAIDDLIGGSEGTLDTLQEIAAALGDDPNFAATIIESLAQKAAIEHTHTVTDIEELQEVLAAKASLSSPVFTGTPKAPTPEVGNSSTKIATTEFVSRAVEVAAVHEHTIGDVIDLQSALNSKSDIDHTHHITEVSGFEELLEPLAPIESPAFIGHPSAPTPPVGNSSNRVATTSFVATAVENATSGKANTVHSHGISDVIGLSNELDKKANSETVAELLAAKPDLAETAAALRDKHDKGAMTLDMTVAKLSALTLDVDTVGITISKSNETGAIITSAGDIIGSIWNGGTLSDCLSEGFTNLYASLDRKHEIGADTLDMGGYEFVSQPTENRVTLRSTDDPGIGMHLCIDGNIYGAAFGGYLTNWVNSLYQDVRSWVYGSFVTDIRLAGWWEAGLGPNSWNYDPGSGAVITALYAAGQTSGGAAIAHRGGRFLQKCIGGGWYAVGSGG